MKNNFLEKIKSKDIDIPNRVSYGICKAILTAWINLRNKPKYYYNFDKTEMKNKQVIIVADHATWDSFFYVMAGYPFVRLNTVVGYHHIFKKWIYLVTMKVFRTIPKKNFQNDVGSVKQMLKLIKKGGSILIFSEGTQSKSGSNVPITPSTAGFLKKMGVTVLLCKSYGSFLARPIFKSKTGKGHQEFHYEILFTPDDLKNLDKDQLYDKMLNRFRYNDFEWNKEKGYEYHCKDGNAKGMEKVLFVCPKCGKEFTLKTTENQIICTDCDNTINVNTRFEFSPSTPNDVCPYENMDQWYKDERKLVKEAVKDENFKLEYDCELFRLATDKTRKDPFLKYGQGHICIAKEGIIFKGNKYQKAQDDSDEISLNIAIDEVPSMLSTPGQFNILYYQNDVFKIVPKDNKNLSIKGMIAVEELHNLVDSAWDKVMHDAYGE